jgi:hypothetical protein
VRFDTRDRVRQPRSPLGASAALAGLYLAWSGHWFSSGWFHGKFALVILMSGVHGFFSRWRKDFEADRNTRSQKFFRIPPDSGGIRCHGNFPSIAAHLECHIIATPPVIVRASPPDRPKDDHP